jgi:hypothetical protein
LELGDHEGGIPGFPNATLAVEDSVAMSVLLIKTQPQHHRRWVSSALLPSRRAIGGSKHLAVAFQLPSYQITQLPNPIEGLACGFNRKSQIANHRLKVLSPPSSCSQPSGLPPF